MASGIYAIVCSVNGSYYVGSTADFYHRWAAHKSDMGRNRHVNPILQAHWNKYGPEAIRFERLAHIDRGALLEVEQRLLDRLCGLPGCMNIAPDATSGMRGRVTSPETKAKLSAAIRGRVLPPRSEEHRARLSAALRGKPAPNRGRSPSEATKAKIREARGRQTFSDETRSKLSAAGMGRVQSAETRQKKAAAATGRRHSDEAKAKMRAAKLGRSLTPEHAAKIAAKATGRRHSAASVELMSHVAASRPRGSSGRFVAGET